MTAPSSKPAREPRDSPAAASIPRLALTAMEAPAARGMCHDYFREHVSGELRWVRRGRKKVVAVRELERRLEANAARVSRTRRDGGPAEHGFGNR